MVWSIPSVVAEKEQSPAAQQVSGGKWNASNYGPFFCSGLWARNDPVYKGISIKLGEKAEAAICFDTELMRIRMGWINGFLQFPKELDGLEDKPNPVGVLVFSNFPHPGWGKKGGFVDPRPVFTNRPYGCLPKDWAHYKGLYVNGNKVILSYTVGNSQVLEMPWFETKNGMPVFSRTFWIDKSEEGMTLQVCASLGASKTSVGDIPVLLNDYKTNQTFAAAGVVFDPPGTVWEVRDDEGIRLKLPPFNKSVLFRVFISSGDKNDFPKVFESLQNKTPLPDLRSLCSGGPMQYPLLQTKGQSGSQTGAFVVDTLALPENNPWHSWIRPTGMDFFPDGRMAICSVSGDAWIISGINQSLGRLTWKRFATGFFQPLGIKIVGENIYVLGRDQITRLHDLNRDGEADFYENFNNDTADGGHYHEFALDLQTDSRTNFYFAKGGMYFPTVPTQGTLIKVSSDGEKSEIFANGLRVPNGIAIDQNDRIYVTENQGHWMPSSKITEVKKGGFHGFVLTSYTAQKPDTYVKPLCWIPYLADNSSGQPFWVNSDRWGPFKNHLFYTSFGTCSLFHVMTEEVDGVQQAAVMKFPLEFDTGIMRGKFNPADGQLYLCGTTGWQTKATKDGGLYRVRYAEKPIHMPLAIRLQTNGLQITFSDPLHPEMAKDPQNFAIEQWNYQWASNYHAVEFSALNPTKKEHDKVEVESVKLSEDGKTINLKLGRVIPVMQMSIKWNIKTIDGTPLRQEMFYTINKVPDF